MINAFPRPISTDAIPADHAQWGDTPEFSEAQDGMSLLDYFAAHSPLTIPNGEYLSLVSLKAVAKQAYLYAQMMMEVRAALVTGDHVNAV
jgi:hypothetical protein